jgi:inhibitor of cysteine peptidase
LKKFDYKKLIALAVILVLISVPAIGFACEGKVFEMSNNSTNEQNSLPVVGTCENFKRMVEMTQNNNNSYLATDGGFYGGVMQKAVADSAAPIPPQAQAASNDFSTTNIQVQGVDESDRVKTDGKYIYQVSGSKVFVTLAYHAAEMKIIKTLEFQDKTFNPFEIYVDSNYLIVIGMANKVMPYDMPQQPGNGGIVPPNGKMIPPYYRGNGIIRTIVFDIKDKNDIKEIRQSDVEGSYVSSRKIDSKLYIVSNKFVDYYLMNQGASDLTPVYKDSAVSSEYKSIGYEKIKYIPDAMYSNFMIIAALDISNNNEMKVEAYLGASQNIYVSNDNLYTAVTKYDYKTYENDTTSSNRPIRIMPESNVSTLVYKFALNNGNITFSSKGEVPGTILNQFSMDEYNGFFRIATTSGSPWQNGVSALKNNIYVLDSEMNIKGKIEDIAPGEKIYSVRFMGDRGYLVTFRTVDPLFVVDFKDPSSPKILGALKIPGYSNYLHPYDENHIIGFGKDAVVLPVKDGNGNQVDSRAYYTGMKIAIFDVTDVNNPKEMFSTQIGDRGTDSEILNDHKALLFSKEKNLLALPVNLFKLKEGQSAVNEQYGNPEYGTFVYQGAYIYNIDLVNGLTLKGRITHISDDEYKKAGDMWYNGLNNVSRILYINDTLYTVSMSRIKASSIDDLHDLSSVTFPESINN